MLQIKVFGFYNFGTRMTGTIFSGFLVTFDFSNSWYLEVFIMVPEVQVIEIDVYVLKYVYFQSAPMGHTDFSVNMLVETVKMGYNATTWMGVV